MSKTFSVTLPDGSKLSRKSSNKIYSHAVVAINKNGYWCASFHSDIVKATIDKGKCLSYGDLKEIQIIPVDIA